MFSEDTELRQIQNACLGILKETVRVCEENNLIYFLCGGSLLGAIRHEGFIPWDDDIDIAMPREDYEKLLSLKDNFNGRYRLNHYSLLSDKNQVNSHTIQIVDTYTLINREWTQKTKEIPVWIDVFPLDGMPRDKLRQQLHYYRYRFYQALMQISNKDNAINTKRERNVSQKLFIRLINMFNIGDNWNTLKLLNKMDKILKRYSINNSDLISSFHGTQGKKEILQGKWYKERTKMKFEDNLYYVPKEYDAIMRHYYGNYMIPQKRYYDHNYSNVHTATDKSDV